METVTTIFHMWLVVSSYRTYEEWKRPTHATYCFINIIVLTVPMRNGNKDRNAEHNELQQCSYRTYEEWKRPLSISL